MERYISIHGHFYQPPRENPWLEAIELQDSAYPYHDWNDRIAAECDAPNAASRILDSDGKIAQIVNNYSKISFDFGPTLLTWLESRSPKVYQAVQRLDYQSFEIGRARLAAGRARFTSDVTRETAVLTFGVLLFGDYNLNAGMLDFHGEEAYGATVQEPGNAFSMADFPQVVLLLDKHFGTSTYSIRSLFRDQQRRVLNTILGSSLSEAEAHYREIYELRVPLMRFLTDLGIPLPRAFQAAAEFTINGDLRRIFGGRSSMRNRCAGC
jgi:hypothetical protein